MPERSQLTRRTLLKGLTATSLFPLLSANLVGCSDSSDSFVDTVPADFRHGVASGDPLVDRVILWTRLTPIEGEGSVRVAWELSEDAGFNTVVASGSGFTDAGVDYTVKVDAQDLQPGKAYYYRFSSDERVSPVGRTRTASTGSVAALSFAAVSCSNYPAGYFNVYREVSRLELDAVLHLGDYIYEYDRDGYASDRAEEFGRVSQPANELLVLSDYRARYGQYRTDPDAQAAHAAHPFIVVWDDHEVANNAWREGADNHTPGTEGDYLERKADAIQAWYEWQPVRPPADGDNFIFRRFRYGDLLDLIMLDTRIFGRDEQYTYAQFLAGSTIDVAAARAAFGDSNRTILGAEQYDWLREQLTDSTARWQVLGQQVLMGRYHLPASIMEALDPSLDSDDALARGTEAVVAAFAARNTPAEERSEEQQALLDSAIPYNLDSWDGYEFERDELFAYARDLDKRLVVLAGDTHNAWNTQLTTPQGEVVGVEFGCASITSPGLENVLGADAVTAFSPIISTLIDDLHSADLSGRGYLHLRFTADQMEASQRFVTTIDSRDYAMDESRTINLRVDRQGLQFQEV